MSDSWRVGFVDFQPFQPFILAQAALELCSLPRLTSHLASGGVAKNNMVYPASQATIAKYILNRAVALAERRILICILELLWHKTQTWVYTLGCVRPGQHGFGWRLVYTSMRHQLLALCRDTYLFRHLWAPESFESGSPRPLLYRDHYKILELYPSNVRPWNSNHFVLCPACHHKWPLNRWTLAETECVTTGGHARPVTFCSLSCPQPKYCPTLTSIRLYCMTTNAPKWVFNIYSSDLPPHDGC